MNQALNIILSGLANANGQFHEHAKKADADALAAQQIQKDLQESADQGDWQHLHDMMEYAQPLIHPAVMQSIVSKTHRQNQRLFDAQTAEGGQPTIPLSPYNQSLRALNRPNLYNPAEGQPAMPVSNPTMAAITAVNGGGENGPLAGMPNNEVMPPGYGQNYLRPGVQAAPEVNPDLSPSQPAGPRTLGEETGSIADLNQQMRSALDQAPGGEPPAQPSAPATPDNIEPPGTGFITRGGGPGEAGGLVVPPNRQPINKTTSLKTAIGNQTTQKSIPGTTGKEVTSSLISQGEQQGMHPQAILSAFNQENQRRLKAGEPALDMDEGAVNSYRTRYWEQSRAQIQRNLQQQGMDPNTAFTQSAQMAFNQNGYVPEQWMQVVKPHPDAQAIGGYANAMKQANDQLEQTIPSLSAPLKSMKPNAILGDLFNKPFLLKAIDSVPLPPEARTRALHEAAFTAHNAYLTAVQQARPDLSKEQQNYFAVSMASKAVGGNIPEQWKAFAEQDLEKLGLASKDNLAIYHSLPPNLRPDPLDADFGQRLNDIRSNLESKAEYRKAFLGTIKTPEGIQAAQQMESGAPTGQGGQGSKGAKPVTPSSIGQMERNIALGQEGRQGQQKADIERKNAVIPVGHLEKLQTADNIYKAGREAQQIAARKDKNGQTIIDKYGDTPGSFRDFWAKIKGGVGRADPVLLAYKNRLAKVYNFERHELTGAATSVYEGSALEPYLPDPSDNVRTGLAKLNNLVQQLGDQLDQKLTQAQADYPRSNYKAFYRTGERQRQEDDAIFNEAKQKAGRK